MTMSTGRLLLVAADCSSRGEAQSAGFSELSQVRGQRNPRITVTVVLTQSQAASRPPGCPRWLLSSAGLSPCHRDAGSPPPWGALSGHQASSDTAA
ncbi:unnamed protein product [Gadus morhua 'NCC']